MIRPPHETAAGIEAAIETWRAILLKLDAETVHQKPSVDRWSISEVVGHLVDSACNNHQRFVRAQYCSELVFPKYEQNEWVSAASYQSCNWETLVQLWYCYNRLIAVLIRNVPESSLSTSCTITPYEPCSLEFLIADYLDHLNHHLNRLAQRIDSPKVT